MDENSVDFVKKFQDLAKEISGENNKAPTSPASDTTFPPLCNTELNGRSSDDSNSDNGIFKQILKQSKTNVSWTVLVFCWVACFVGLIYYPFNDIWFVANQGCDMPRLCYK